MLTIFLTWKAWQTQERLVNVLTHNDIISFQICYDARFQMRYVSNQTYLRDFWSMPRWIRFIFFIQVIFLGWNFQQKWMIQQTLLKHYNHWFCHSPWLRENRFWEHPLNGRKFQHIIGPISQNIELLNFEGIVSIQ